MKRRILVIALLAVLMLAFLVVDVAMIALSSRVVTVSPPPADAAQVRVVPNGEVR